MSMMMNISHRLFAAAVSEGGDSRRSSRPGGRPAVIEVGNLAAVATPGNGRAENGNRRGADAMRWSSAWRLG